VSNPDLLNVPKPKPRKLILLSSRKLEAALAGERLTSRDKLRYLIVPAVATALFGPAWLLSPRYSENPPPLLNLISMACSVLSAVLVYKGIERCYRTNRRIDGRSFFERYVLLSLPPSVVTGCIFLVLMLAVPVVALGPMKDYPHVQKWYPAAQYALGPLCVMALYWLANRSFIRYGRLLEFREQTTSDDIENPPPPLPS
jgi:hypothetical protein